MTNNSDLEKRCIGIYWRPQDFIGYASLLLGGTVGTIVSYNFISKHPEAVGAGAMATAFTFCVAAAKYCNYRSNHPNF